MAKRKAKPDPRYAEQPAVAAILKLVHRPRGAAVAEIAKARGLQPHTVRSILSRLGSKAGLELTRTKVEGRGGVSHCGQGAGRQVTVKRGLSGEVSSAARGDGLGRTRRSAGREIPAAADIGLRR
jgi:hypothetical protein